MYEYRCKVVKVIDGDTVDVDIDLGFGIWQMDERVRIMGIDTPESRTRDKVEKAFGLAAKAKLKELQDDWDAKEYQRTRIYPDIGEQLDLLYHDMIADKGDKTGEWFKAVKKVKDDNPKPSE